ncbi:hypothetical protein OAD41_00285 [bacterium]|nr:hypothetical protein [bacterium]
MSLDYLPTFIIYLLGVALYLSILEQVEENANSYSVVFTAFLWPYVAVRVILYEIFGGEE